MKLSCLTTCTRLPTVLFYWYDCALLLVLKWSSFWEVFYKLLTSCMRHLIPMPFNQLWSSSGPTTFSLLKYLLLAEMKRIEFFSDINRVESNLLSHINVIKRYFENWEWKTTKCPHIGDWFCGLNYSWKRKKPFNLYFNPFGTDLEPFNIG